MERETKKIITPQKHTLIVYAYATGREAREVEQVYLKAVKMDVNKMAETSIKEFDSTAPYEAEKQLLSKLVVSLDDSNENVLDRLLDLPQSEYEFVVGEVNEITKKK